MDLIARTPKQLGDALRRFRRLRMLTQGDIGSRVGLRQATISSVENGEPGTQIRTLTEILKALDLELVLRDRRKAGDVDIQDLFP